MTAGPIPGDQRINNKDLVGRTARRSIVKAVVDLAELQDVIVVIMAARPTRGQEGGKAQLRLAG